MIHKPTKKELAQLAGFKNESRIDSFTELTYDIDSLRSFVSQMVNSPEHEDDRVLFSGDVGVEENYWVNYRQLFASKDLYRGMVMNRGTYYLILSNTADFERHHMLSYKENGLEALIFRKSRDIESAADVLPLDWEPERVRAIDINFPINPGVFYRRFYLHGQVYALTMKK